MTRDDFDYALENTHVILAPEGQIATFGSTSFNFYLISELMDRVNQVRIRNGKVHAERPQILTPEHYCRLATGRLRRQGGAIRGSPARARAEHRGAPLRFSISQNRSKRTDAAATQSTL